MSLPHRIAGAELTFRDNEVLLVRYKDKEGGSFLVGPGGGLKESENVIDAIIRETEEETGIKVKPRTVLAIEDLLCPKFKMSKVWMICEFIDGEIVKTHGAEVEGIIEAGWYSRERLSGEVVFPSLLLEYSWDELASDLWRVICFPCRNASF
jgi:8-oxo-dGTP pyrophosphatase MutT (NUDIX family)